MHLIHRYFHFSIRSHFLVITFLNSQFIIFTSGASAHLSNFLYGQFSLVLYVHMYSLRSRLVKPHMSKLCPHAGEYRTSRGRVRLVRGPGPQAMNHVHLTELSVCPLNHDTREGESLTLSISGSGSVIHDVLTCGDFSQGGHHAVHGSTAKIHSSKTRSKRL
jgi:hypothetical protein